MLEKNININCFFNFFTANIRKNTTTKITENAYEYCYVYKQQFHTRLALFHCTFDFIYAKLCTCKVVNDFIRHIYGVNGDLVRHEINNQTNKCTKDLMSGSTVSCFCCGDE